MELSFNPKCFRLPTENYTQKLLTQGVYNSEFRMIVSLSGGRACLASVEPGVGQGQVCKKGRKKGRRLISEIYLFVQIVCPKREGVVVKQDGS